MFVIRDHWRKLHECEQRLYKLEHEECHCSDFRGQKHAVTFLVNRCSIY
jgi:hypothetical protein